MEREEDDLVIKAEKVNRKNDYEVWKGMECIRITKVKWMMKEKTEEVSREDNSSVRNKNLG